MVDEAGWTAHVATVADVLAGVVEENGTYEFVEIEEEVGLVVRKVLPTAVCFFGGDYFAPVGFDELTFLEIFFASET